MPTVRNPYCSVSSSSSMTNAFASSSHSSSCVYQLIIYTALGSSAVPRLTFDRVTCVYARIHLTSPSAKPPARSPFSPLIISPFIFGSLTKGVTKSKAAQAISSRSFLGTTKPASDVGEGGSGASGADER